MFKDVLANDNGELVVAERVRNAVQIADHIDGGGVRVDVAADSVRELMISAAEVQYVHIE